MAKCKVPSCNEDMSGNPYTCDTCWQWLRDTGNVGLSDDSLYVKTREAHLQNLKKEESKPKPKGKCCVPSCTNPIGEKLATWCNTCYEWMKEEYKQFFSESHTESTERREAHLQSLKVTQTPKPDKCIFPGCGDNACKESEHLSGPLCKIHRNPWGEACIYNVQDWIKSLKKETPKLEKCRIDSCNNPKQKYNPMCLWCHSKYDSDKDSKTEDEYIDRMNAEHAKKTQPTELTIQPLGDNVSVKDNGVRWGWYDSDNMNRDDHSTHFAEVVKLFVEPNAQGTLTVSHTLKDGEQFVQEFKFGDHSYRTDHFKEHWSQHENFNAMISDAMTKRIAESNELKPSETNTPYTAPLSKAPNKCHVMSCDNDHNRIHGNKYHARLCHECHKNYEAEGHSYVYEYVNKRNEEEQARKAFGSPEQNQEVKIEAPHWGPVVVNITNPVFTNDADQLKRMGEAVGKVRGDGAAVGAMTGAALKPVSKGQLVTSKDVDTQKGFPKLFSPEQVKAIESAISLQTPEGLFTYNPENLLDKCDDSPNVYEVTATKVTGTPQEQRTMNTKDLYSLPILKEDATDAGIRLAGRQFTKATREVLAAAISDHLAPGDDSIRGKVGEFLKTDLGEALLQSLLSVGLSTLPESTGNVPAVLSRELRVSSMLGVGDVFADLLMKPLREVTSLYLASVPKEATHTLEAQSQSVVKVNIPVEIDAEVKR